MLQLPVQVRGSSVCGLVFLGTNKTTTIKCNLIQDSNATFKDQGLPLHSRITYYLRLVSDGVGSVLK